MNQFVRDTAPRRARDTASQITNAGIKLPAEVTAALAVLETVTSLKPEPVNDAVIIAAYLDGAGDRALELSLAASTHRLRHTNWAKAEIQAGLAVMRAITANGDSLTAALAKKAAPLIEELTTAAELGSDVTNLLLSGDRDGAEVLARAGHTTAQLRALYAIRDAVTEGADYGSKDGATCGTWKDPRPVLSANAKSYIEGIQAGGELWFPTPAEAQAAAAIVRREEQAKAEAIAREQERRTGINARPSRKQFIA